MPKVRVHELAKELNLASADILFHANELGIKVKTASSGLTDCLLYTSPSPRDATLSRMPSSA